VKTAKLGGRVALGPGRKGGTIVCKLVGNRPPFNHCHLKKREGDRVGIESLDDARKTAWGGPVSDDCRPAKEKYHAWKILHAPAPLEMIAKRIGMALL